MNNAPFDVQRAKESHGPGVVRVCVCALSFRWWPECSGQSRSEPFSCCNCFPFLFATNNGGGWQNFNLLTFLLHLFYLFRELQKNDASVLTVLIAPLVECGGPVGRVNSSEEGLRGERLNISVDCPS